MASTSNGLLRDPLRRLVFKLAVATVAVAVTAAIAFHDRPVVERRHAPLAETATTTPEPADAVTTTAVASEHGTRP